MSENFFKIMTHAFTNKINNQQPCKVVDIKDIEFTNEEFKRNNEKVEISRSEKEEWGVFDPANYKKQEF